MKPTPFELHSFLAQGHIGIRMNLFLTQYPENKFSLPLPILAMVSNSILSTQFPLGLATYKMLT